MWRRAAQAGAGVFYSRGGNQKSASASLVFIGRPCPLTITTGMMIAGAGGVLAVLGVGSTDDHVGYDHDHSTRSNCRLLCEAASSSDDGTKQQQRLRKRATLQQAVGLERRAADDDNVVGDERSSLPFSITAAQHQQPYTLAWIQRHRTATLRRWERDEDGWRELPARAWPAVQPTEAEMDQNIFPAALAQGCYSSNHTNSMEGNKKKKETSLSPSCQELLFQIATTLVFYNVDPEAGLAQFRELATKYGHVDSMVACGVVLVEGLGVKPRERQGLEWLQRAVAAGSSQACYELGTLYYTGVDGVLDEDAEKAFALFERAAAGMDHTAALYMMADCLSEGEGTERNLARAVPLFYAAAERGHRFARQRIRELLEAQELH